MTVQFLNRISPIACPFDFSHGPQLPQLRLRNGQVSRRLLRFQCPAQWLSSFGLLATGSIEQHAVSVRCDDLRHPDFQWAFFLSFGSVHFVFLWLAIEEKGSDSQESHRTVIKAMT